MKLIRILLVGFTIALLSGCRGGGHVQTCYDTGTCDPIYDTWYDVYGYYCGDLKAGCDFYRDGTKIHDNEDPWYYSTVDWYVYYSYYYGQTVYESPSGIIYDYYGHALNSDEVDEGADILSATADDQQKTAEAVGKQLAARFSLSDEKGIEAATTLMDAAHIAKTRARTQKDMDQFITKLYGVKLSDVTDAFEKQDSVAMGRLLNDAAGHWGTTPETMKEILKSFYGKRIGLE